MVHPVQVLSRLQRSDLGWAYSWGFPPGQQSWPGGVTPGWYGTGLRPWRRKTSTSGA